MTSMGRTKSADVDFPVRTIITIRTDAREQLVDITRDVSAIVSQQGKKHRLCFLYTVGATAAIMVQENWDPNIQIDVLACLKTLVPQGRWIHDTIDGNGDAHIKAGIIGPSEAIPIEDGKLLLGTWQNIFFCEFDGPRDDRRIIVTLI